MSFLVSRAVGAFDLGGEAFATARSAGAFTADTSAGQVATANLVEARWETILATTLGGSVVLESVMPNGRWAVISATAVQSGAAVSVDAAPAQASWETLPATAKTPSSGPVPILRRRISFQDQWSFDGGETWVTARLQRVDFQDFIVADIGSGDEQVDLRRIYNNWFWVQ